MHCYKILLDRTGNEEEHPCHNILPVKFGTEGVSVQTITCYMFGECEGHSIIKVWDNRNDSLREGVYETGFGECTVSKVSSKCYLAMVVNRKCLLSRLISLSGCFLTSAVPRTDTIIEWTLIGPNSSALHSLVDSMRKNGYSFKLISSENLSNTVSLTPKQEQYFDMAFRMGYYDVPKRTDLNELCKLLGCSKSTLNVCLRTAEKKVFDYYRMSVGGHS